MKTLSTPKREGFSLLLTAFLFAFTLFSVTTKAGGLWLPAGGRQAGLDHCSVALSGFWSVQNNVAGMAAVEKLSAGTGFQNGYLSPHLGTAGLALVYPAAFGRLGASFRYFGYSMFHQMEMSISYARNLGKKIRAGVQLVYVQTGFGDIYGQRGNFTFGIGFQADISKNLVLGFSIFNPLPAKPEGEADVDIPGIYKLGLAYTVGRDLLVTVEAEKNTFWQPVVIRGGVEYRFKKQFFLRAGVATSGDIFAIGLGWRKNKLQINLAATMHQSLGFSPQASMVFAF